ncbi:hypothetical protein ACFQY4_32400 [Catellatospora bangladeshensis]|uniref:hypothetical protein n=1 Tax=Catellatospora bangladeshensis TaxID=310355 RepID=UPI00361DB29C
MATLLVPGVTLPWLVRRTGLTGGALRRQEAARRIVAAAQEAGLHRLEELRADGTVGPETARRLGSGSGRSCWTRTPRTRSG